MCRVFCSKVVDTSSGCSDLRKERIPVVDTRGVIIYAAVVSHQFGVQRGAQLVCICGDVVDQGHVVLHTLGDRIGDVHVPEKPSSELHNCLRGWQRHHGAIQRFPRADVM